MIHPPGRGFAIDPTDPVQLRVRASGYLALAEWIELQLSLPVAGRPNDPNRSLCAFVRTYASRLDAPVRTGLERAVVDFERAALAQRRRLRYADN